MQAEEGLRVLELFSGIGGMHYALIASQLPARIVAAVDINDVANKTYAHNFPECNLVQKTIESISVEEFEKLQVDMILMSPPCQPFTRLGNQEDISDPRSKAFLYILNVLSSIRTKPPFLLLENVASFEESEAHKMLLATLEAAEYNWQEFLLSPIQFGIPNSRLRYFIIAKRKEQPFCFETTKEVMRTCPSVCSQWLPRVSAASDAVSTSSYESNGTSTKQVNDSWLNCSNVVASDQCCDHVRSLNEFVQNECENQSFFMTNQLLLKRSKLFDIVLPSSTRSCCFTKGYGRYVEGTGSVLQTAVELDTKQIFSQAWQAEDEKKLDLLRSLKLRYFTPREVANLHCFPASFEFPSTTSSKQRWRLLGNSLNVFVVEILLRLLLERRSNTCDAT